MKLPSLPSIVSAANVEAQRHMEASVIAAGKALGCGDDETLDAAAARVASALTAAQASNGSLSDEIQKARAAAVESRLASDALAHDLAARHSELLGERSAHAATRSRWGGATKRLMADLTELAATRDALTADNASLSSSCASLASRATAAESRVVEMDAAITASKLESAALREAAERAMTEANRQANELLASMDAELLAVKSERDRFAAGEKAAESRAASAIESNGRAEVALAEANARMKTIENSVPAIHRAHEEQLAGVLRERDHHKAVADRHRPK